jgi:hypothetical protein
MKIQEIFRRVTTIWCSEKLYSEERLPAYHTRMAIPSMGMAMGALLELR